MDSAFATAEAYVEQFYPLWFSYYQAVATNQLLGPATVTPIYQEVVAINVDTLYASAFVDVTDQPVILTIPATTATYSILSLDPYGDVLSSGIPALTAGTYALVAPGYTGTLPSGVTPVTMPLDNSLLIFRVDKSSSTGIDETTAATTFRASLEMQALSDYETDPSGGATNILPVAAFAAPFKDVADNLIATDPMLFLKMLQTAVASSSTPALTPEQTELSNELNQLLANGSNLTDLAAGVQAAHQAIVDDYLDNTGPTNWIHFTNIGNWGDNVLDRSAITEFIQYGNNSSAAAYYQTFDDAAGAPLNGSTPGGYVLTFPPGDLPQADRFWSLTAYTPNSIELIPNSADKYEVASYTPDLQFNPDGSLSIYISQQQPAGVPAANWLPVSTDLFNIMLRVYGPEGSVAANTYVPPAITLVDGSQNMLTQSGLSDAIMTDANGVVVLDEMSGGAMGYTQISAIGPEWQFEGQGPALGDGRNQILLWNNSTGAIVTGEVNNESAAYTQIGGVGPEWQFEGVGAIAGGNNFLIWNSNNDALAVGAVSSGTATYTQIGTVGPEWSFEGVGAFLGDGSTDFLLWDTDSASPSYGTVEVGKDVGGTAQYTVVGGFGPEWQFEGSGDLLNDGKDSILLRSSTSGALVVGELNGGSLQYTQVGGVGSEWQFLGVGNYDGQSPAEFLMLDAGANSNGSGALVIGTVSGGTATYTQVGGVDPTQWTFHPTNPALLA